MIFTFRSILWLTPSSRLLYIYFIYTCWRSFGLFNSQVTFNIICYNYWIYLFDVALISYSYSFYVDFKKKMDNYESNYHTIRVLFESCISEISQHIPFCIMEYYYLEKKIVAFHLYWTYPWMIWSRYYFLVILFIVNGILRI